jgi:chaperonin GroES
MANFRPLYDRVLIKRIDAEEKTAGGLYIPDSAQEKPQEGRVIAAGPGRLQKSGELRPLEVKAGDHVLFGKYSGEEMNLDGAPHLILKEEDILAIIG